MSTYHVSYHPHPARPSIVTVMDAGPAAAGPPASGRRARICSVGMWGGLGAGLGAELFVVVGRKGG